MFGVIQEYADSLKEQLYSLQEEYDKLLEEHEKAEKAIIILNNMLRKRNVKNRRIRI